MPLAVAGLFEIGIVPTSPIRSCDGIISMEDSDMSSSRGGPVEMMAASRFIPDKVPQSRGRKVMSQQAPAKGRPHRARAGVDEQNAALLYAHEWLAPGVNDEMLACVGIKSVGGGPHQSKTMMLPELKAILANRGKNRPADMILRDNVLGKPSARARQAALLRLRQLYGLDQDYLICKVMRRLWDRDPHGQPMLALLCALARDPTLRDGAAAVLDAPLGERVRWPAIAAAFETRHPGRLGEKMAKSLAQNAASTWTQAGFLHGAVRKHSGCRIGTLA